MLKVNGRAWKILLVKPNNINLVDDNGIYTLGMTDNLKSTIYLSDRLNNEMLYKVLCHEVVHAYCFSYNLIKDRAEEERLAQFISEYGRSIISDTDSLLKHILYSNIAL